jgi:hypothetical protein
MIYAIGPITLQMGIVSIRRRSLRAAVCAGTAAVLAGVCSACAPSLVSHLAMTAPNPIGCYVKVYDEAQFRGAADFVNGPMRYSTLTAMPNAARWSKRIRSAQVGPAATVTVWTDVNFTGTSMQMGTDRAYPTLPRAVAGDIESMVVNCTSARTAPPA